MNWFKEANLQEQMNSVKSALMTLHYTRPDLDPSNCDFPTLVAALQESGKVPDGINPERFATMVIFHVKNQEFSEEDLRPTLR